MRTNCGHPKWSSQCVQSFLFLGKFNPPPNASGPPCGLALQIGGFCWPCAQHSTRSFSPCVRVRAWKRSMRTSLSPACNTRAVVSNAPCCPDRDEKKHHGVALHTQKRPVETFGRTRVWHCRPRPVSNFPKCHPLKRISTPVSGRWAQFI